MQAIATIREQRRDKLILADILAGLATGFAVSPLNTVVDKSVMEYANRKFPSIWTATFSCLKNMVTHPLRFMAGFQFRWMCVVFLPTFAVSNVADHFNLTDDVPRPMQKLAAVFLTNTSLSLIKDRIYILRLNPHKPIQPLPISSLFLLFTRDLIAMTGAFTLPPIAALYLSQHYTWNYSYAERSTQLLIPPLMQLVLVPIHLLALGLYNDKGKSMGEHAKYIRGIYWSTVALKMMRFLPGYGIGGVFNIELRKYLKGRVPYESL